MIAVISISWIDMYAIVGSKKLAFHIKFIYLIPIKKYAIYGHNCDLPVLYWYVIAVVKGVNVYNKYTMAVS